MGLTEVGYLAMEPVRVLFSIRLVLPSSGCHPLLLTPCYWPASWKKGAKILGGSHFLFPILIGRGLLQRERRVSGLLPTVSSISKRTNLWIFRISRWDALNAEIHGMLRCTGCWDTWDAEILGMLRCMECWGVHCSSRSQLWLMYGTTHTSQIFLVLR